MPAAPWPDGYYVQVVDSAKLGYVAPEVYNLLGLKSDFGTNPLGLLPELVRCLMVLRNEVARLV